MKQIISIAETKNSKRIVSFVEYTKIYVDSYVYITDINFNRIYNTRFIEM